MKILKESKPPEWSKEYSCTGDGNGNKGCGSLLLVSKSDLFQTCHQSYGDSSPDYFVTFKCPVCKELTDIDDSPFRGFNLPKQYGIRFPEGRRH